MNFTQRYHLRLAFMCMLEPDKDKGGAAPKSDPPLTIEQQLSAANADRDTARQERDQARSDITARDTTVSTLTSERDTARQERDQARNDLSARDKTISTITGERDQARTESATRATRITQLESALGVSGVDVNNLPKVPAGKPGNTAEDLRAQLSTCTDPAQKADISRQLRALSEKR